MKSPLPAAGLPPGSMLSSLGLGAKIALVIAAVMFFAWLGVYRIDAGHVGIVKRFGNVIDVVDPGLHYKLPYADTVEEMEVRERAFSIDLDAASQDPLELPIKVTVNWLVKRAQVKDLYVQFGSLDQFEKRIILPRLNDAVKGVTSRYMVNDLLRKRVEYRDLSMKVFEERMPEDVQITGFSIVNIGFPPEYTKAIRDKQVAREQAETEKFVLDRQRLTTRAGDAVRRGPARCRQGARRRPRLRDQGAGRGPGRRHPHHGRGAGAESARGRIQEGREVGRHVPDDVHGRRRRRQYAVVPAGPGRRPARRSVRGRARRARST